MAFEIENEKSQVETDVPQVPRKSIVQVYFPEREMTLTYYNDLFDLHFGDIVYVDGKLEGMRGRVTDVNYNFRIRLSDYKRVIGVADTEVHGQFFLLESHFVTFDRAALPGEKAVSWFRAPSEEEFIRGRDDAEFSIEDLSGLNVSAKIAERGRDYYMENRVRYMCLDGEKGYAIVEGSENYEVEFTYREEKISGLTCSCYCGCNCKHEFAAMLQLRDILGGIEMHYPEKFTEYFAAVARGTFYTFVLNSREYGSFTL